IEMLDDGAVDFHHLRRRDVRRFEWKFFAVHDVLNPSAQSLLEVLGHPKSIRHDRQCGIHGPTRDKEAAVNDVKIIEIVRLAIDVERGPPGVAAEPNDAALVRGASIPDVLGRLYLSRT